MIHLTCIIVIGLVRFGMQVSQSRPKFINFSKTLNPFFSTHILTLLINRFLLKQFFFIWYFILFLISNWLVLHCHVLYCRFDCVYPTRTARFGVALLPTGTLRLKAGSQCAADRSAVESGCPCVACTQYTRAMLHVMFRENNPLAAQLLTIHNITYMMRLMRSMREVRREGGKGGEGGREE